jgi:hypothetical protein
MKISDELAKLRILVSEFEALEPGLDRASATNYDGDAWHSDLLKLSGNGIWDSGSD